MKKTKLLMPLMGLTVLGAVAPVMTITSCNKGPTVIFDDSTLGNMYDETKMLVTNRLGEESIYVDDEQLMGFVNLEFKCHLANVSSETRKFQVSILKQGTINEVDEGHEDEAGTPFIITMSPKTLQIRPYSSWIRFNSSDFDTGEAHPIATNRKKIKYLKDNNLEESFKFYVTFEELNDDDVVISKQDVWYTLVACPAQHDLPKITPIDSGEGFTGTANGTSVTFTGVSFSNLPKAGADSFSIEAYNNPYTRMTEEHTEEQTSYNKILVYTDYVTKDSDGKISFSGWADNEIKSSTNFSLWHDINISMICKDNNTETPYFVLPEWQCTLTVHHTYGTEWNVNPQ